MGAAYQPHYLIQHHATGESPLACILTLPAIMTEAAYWEDFNICKSCVIHFVPQPPLSQVTSTGPWEGWQVQLLTSPRGFAPPRFYASDEDLDRPLMRYHQLIFEAL